jgi:FlaA1/EpsC-like NDP-sugar epimerase
MALAVRLKVLLLGLPRFTKCLVAIIVDGCLCIFTLWLAHFLRLGEFVALQGNSLWAGAISILLAVPIFIGSGFYRAIFRYIGPPTLLTIARAITVYGLLYATIYTAIGISGVPRTVGIIQPILLLLFIGISRMFARFWLGADYEKHLKILSRPKVLIYGAGSAGRQLAAGLNSSHEMEVVGFLDDDRNLHGQILNGLRIYDPDLLSDIRGPLKVSDVLLAIPSLARTRRNEILAHIRSAHVAVRTLPNLNDLAKGIVHVSDVRELDVEDLLGRDPVEPDPELMAKNLNGKTVLVTGAGGSIGSELCRQIIAYSPKKLILVEQSEFALYSIHDELKHRLEGLTFSDNLTHLQLVPLLGSVQDYSRMFELMSFWKPHTVYHAAAYKHVPLVEANPFEGIRNNVFGTLHTVKAAIDSGVSDFVLISTDKAVRPTSIMGASKRVAELILQALSAEQVSTRLSMVRFGNVLGSSGSVVPIFRKQIRNGGPITLTHPDVTRFFMTIPEAAQLVIQAGSLAKGGDVFVLDMGEPVKIYNLARRMIELSGFSVRDTDNPEGDIEITIIGLRPGEKLHEELLIGSCLELTAHVRIRSAIENFQPWLKLEAALFRLDQAADNKSIADMLSILQKIVVGLP